MRQLLKTNEVRRIALVEELTSRPRWITLSELAKKLSSSESSIKEDIAYFRKTYTFFTIETSYQGVRIEFEPDSGLKNFYQSILADSLAYNLIEEILYVEELTEDMIINQFYISQSTLYRLVKDINDALSKQFDITLQTNPFKFVGSEDNIRYFYYVYFNERYNDLNYSFPSIDKQAVDDFLNTLLEIYQIKPDFPEYLNLKLVTIVNLFRYKNNHFAVTSHDEEFVSKKLSTFNANISLLKPFEEKLHIKINKEALLQIFNNYISNYYSVTYEELMSKAETNQNLKDSIEYLSNLIDFVSTKFEIPFKNREIILLNMSNAAYNERSKPYNKYILYNRTALTIERFFKNFPFFSNTVSEGLQEYRNLVQLSSRNCNLNNLYIEFALSWEGLVYELQTRWTRTNILIVSDISYGHAKTIEEILKFSFNNIVSTRIQKDYNFSFETVSDDVDLVVANFSIKSLPNTPIVYIENIPTVKNLKMIQQTINEINLIHKKRDYYMY